MLRGFKGFLESDAGALIRHKKRRERRVQMLIPNLEPQSKKMRTKDRLQFQNDVAAHLNMVKRRTFRGDIALRLDLCTAGKSPPHAHTIAKNFLDLLSTTMPDAKWPGKHLLYRDDSQIQALSVQCRHGDERPSIIVEARPMASMLDDLELAADAVRANETLMSMYEREQEIEWIDTLRDLVKNEAEHRGLLGDDGYEGYFKMVRWSAQRALLTRSVVGVPELAWMYGRPEGIPSGFDKTNWAKMLAMSPLRLQMGELPIASGDAAQFKQRVADAISSFKERFDWIIDPLVVAVGIEVVVRPNPRTPPAVLHDLDNIVRDYVIPGIVPAFGTVSDMRWTIDFDELRKTDPRLAEAWGPNPTPPAGTRNGVTRYEVWRLPAVEGEDGFVSVALISDDAIKGDLMQQTDAHIREWQKSLPGSKRDPWAELDSW